MYKKKRSNLSLDSYISQLDYIDVKISATHLDFVNINDVLYTIDAGKKGVDSWKVPFNKPQLLHHDKSRDAIGRIIDATVANTPSIKGEPSHYVELTSRITDKDAISKVIKGIYLTCSVGSSTNKVRCSVCDQVITRDGLCEHKKGSTHKGNRVYWIVDQIEYVENSFVNNPADQYARIISIDLGDGFIPFDKFLEDKDSILKNLFMEDSMKKRKVTAEDRAQLPESSFCGPDMSFPAHTKECVEAGISAVGQANFSDSLKKKLLSSLYRKGQRFEVQPSVELSDSTDFMVYRMEDSFTEEEIKEVKDFFEKNPESDVPLEDSVVPEATTEPDKKVFTLADSEEVKKAKKEDLINFVDLAISEIDELKKKLSESEDKIKSLTDEVETKGKLVISKEDEINKLLDSVAKVSIEYKKCLVDSILDLKKSKNREKDYTIYESRKIDSLQDSIVDLRNGSFDAPKVLNDSAKPNEPETVKSEQTLSDDKFVRFFNITK